MSWLALDIGGANLKVADGCGYAASQPFLLWKQPEQLPQAIAELITRAPTAERIAVTMTGELADCYETKAEGVSAILEAVDFAARGREVLVYLCNGQFVTPQAARAEPLLAGASNWHALASFATRYRFEETALLMDIGSTTTDLIPLGPTGPDSLGNNDPERLVSGELIYTGVRRSPVCALVNELPWRGDLCRVAQELFATTADVFLLLSDLPEDSADRSTADGRPSTREGAHARLARMICADTSLVFYEDAKRMAEVIQSAQLDLLENAARKVIQRMKIPPQSIVLSGEGEFLARRVSDRLRIDVSIVSLNEKLGTEVSRAAAAHALAALARERCE